MARSLPRAAIVAALFLFLTPSLASAHPAFVSGTPSPGDEVAGSPDELVIKFSQDLEPSRTLLEVRDALGATVARGGELGDGPREFRLALPELSSGEYEVRWTSFSAEDGELARDAYTFTVIAAPSPSPSPSLAPSSAPASPSPSPDPPTPVPSLSPASRGEASGSGDGTPIVPILAAALVVGGLAVWLLRRRAA